MHVIMDCYNTIQCNTITVNMKGSKKMLFRLIITVTTVLRDYATFMLLQLRQRYQNFSTTSVYVTFRNV